MILWVVLTLMIAVAASALTIPLVRRQDVKGFVRHQPIEEVAHAHRPSR